MGGDGATLPGPYSRHRLKHQLLCSGSTLEAIPEERKVELLKERRLDAQEVPKLNVLQTDPATREGAEELEEVGIAGGLLANLTDQRQPETAPCASNGDGQCLLGRVKLEVAARYVH